MKGFLCETEDTPTHFFFFFVLCFAPHSFRKPHKQSISPTKTACVYCLEVLCICNPFLMASGFLRLPTQLFSPDLRRNDEAISCIHLGMILQNLTLVSTSVQLCVLFSWICWCFIYVGHVGCYAGLARAVCTLTGAFHSATFVSHICHRMKGWSEEVQGNVSLWWVWSSAALLHFLEETLL